MRFFSALLRWLALVALAGLLLQVFFIARIAAMLWWNPASTTFERSEAWRLANTPLAWQQRWVPYDAIADTLKRAVIASEDALFTQHDGVDWKAIEKARLRNDQMAQRQNTGSATARIRGGSTITQQLAKNLLLSGERTLLRKGQELVLTYTLEHLLDKQRILEIYLNHVEWGEGIFGAQAAAQHYFGKDAARLNASEAARLAVLLPQPKRLGRNLRSSYVQQRSRTIAVRMNAVRLP